LRNGSEEKKSGKKRDELARKIAENKGIELDEEINWQDHVRNYKALSDLVLPEIFEKITGSREGYQDLTPDRLGPEKTVEQIEEWRQELQQKKRSRC